MGTNTQATTTVYVNNEPAKKALSEIEAKLLQVTEARKEAFEKGDFAGLKKLDTEAKSLGAEAEKLKKRFFDVNLVLKDLAGASKNDLYKALSMVTTELNKMRQTDPGFAAKKKQVDDLAEAYKKASEKTNSFSKDQGFLKGAFSEIKTMLPTLGIGALITGLVAAGKEIFTLSKTMEADARKSSIVLGDSLGYVQKQAEGAASKMGVTNREFIAMVANTADLLVPLGFTRDKAAELSLGLQNLTGALDEWTEGKYGAEEISLRLTKAVLGETDSLKEMGIGISLESAEYKNLVKQKMAVIGTTQEQAKAMAILEMIQQKSTDAQTAYAASGNELLRAQKGIVAGWRSIKESVTAWFQTPSYEKIEKERQSVNALAAQLYDANLSYTDRKKILDELNRIAPDVSKNLNAEAIDYDTLTKNLEAYNNQMINRYVLEKKNAEITDWQNKVGEQTSKREAARSEINQKLLKITQQLNDAMARNPELIDESQVKLAQSYLKLKDIGEKIKQITSIGSIDQSNTGLINEVLQLQQEFIKSEQKINDLQGKGSELNKQKLELMETLGIKESDNSAAEKAKLEKEAADKAKDDKAKADKEAADKAAKEKAKAYKKALEEQKKYLDEVLKSGLNATEKENFEYQERLKKAGIFGKDKSKLSADQLKALEILEKQHTDNLFNIDKDNRDKTKAVQEKWNAEILQLDAENNQAIIDLLKARYVSDLEAAGDDIDKRKAIEEKYRQDVLTAELGQLKSRKAIMIGLGVSTAEIEKLIVDKKLEILEDGWDKEDEAKKERDEIRKEYNLQSSVEQEADEIAKLEEHYKNKQLTTEEYEKALLGIKLSYTEKYIQEYQNLLNGLSNAVTSIRDAELEHIDADKEEELAKLEDKKNRGLVTEEQYSKEKNKIEDKFQKQQNDTKKKYAGLEFSLKVAQIIADTAVSAIKAYSAMAAIPIVGPALGIAAAAAAVFAGGAQLAIAQSQHRKIMQLYTGGFTSKDSSNYTPVGVVHANEFVANADAVVNPTVKPVLDVIDLAQRTGTIRSINLPAAIANSFNLNRGLRDGGFSSQNSTVSSPSVTVSDQNIMINAALAQSINRLNDKLDNLYVKLVMDEFKKAEADYDKMKSDVSRG